MKTTIRYHKEIGYRPGLNFSQIKRVWPIRPNTIIHKTTCGVGATHGEIIAPRDSIIVLPHISVIKSKYEKHSHTQNMLAVYGDITPEQIAEHFRTNTNGSYVKILTTPKGLTKVIKAVNDLKVDYRDSFFVLMDECHKLVKDTSYRDDLLIAMDAFFTFKQRALVSATPLAFSDERFSKFKHVRLYPKIKERIKVDIIHTNSTFAELKKHLDKRGDQRYCIFFNTVSGIQDIINRLNIQGNSYLFCSEKTQRLYNFSEGIDAQSIIKPLKRYNFFTSAFFNGLDIELSDSITEVIIVTDATYKSQTVLDPFTDIYQIIGRFRKRKLEDGRHVDTFKSITHINSVAKRFIPPTPQEAISKLEVSKEVYKQIQSLKFATNNPALQENFDHVLQNIRPYFNLLNKSGKYSQLLEDNYFDLNRVKQYYVEGSSLLNAYLETDRYMILSHDSFHEKRRINNLSHVEIRYTPDLNRIFANQLLELEEIAGTKEAHEALFKIRDTSPLIFQAYFDLGYEFLQNAEFNKRIIEVAHNKYIMHEKSIQTPVIQAIYHTFRLNKVYSSGLIKSKLRELFDELGFEFKPSATYIERYFHIAHKTGHTNNKSVRSYLFTDYKFNFDKPLKEWYYKTLPV